jgi:hypothetical protein
LPIERDVRIDLIEVTVAAPLEPDGVLSAHTPAPVLSDFFTLLDWPYSEQAKAGYGAADTERSLGHC